MGTIRSGAVVAAILAVGCGDDAPADVDAAADPPDAAVPLDAAPPDATPARCPYEQPLQGGFACAIQPSATLEGISDAFGYHVIGVPDGADASTPLYIFFKGTGSIPFDPSSGYVGISLQTVQEGVSHGYVVLIIAYDSSPGLEFICADDVACYGAVRREIVEGIEANDPGDVKHVRPPDDVFSRVDALLSHLADLPALDVAAAVDWSTSRLGGGSQGGGLAGYIAKEHRTVVSACTLAGLGDSGSISGEPATWVVSTTWMTPLAELRGLIHAQDPYFERATSTWHALGLELDVSYRVLTDATTNPHGFVQGDPAATDDRTWACFE